MKKRSRKMKEIVKIILALSFINSLFSWTAKTHTYIGEIVYTSLPPSFQDLLDKSEFLSGCVAPDKREYNYIFKWKHVYHPRTSFGGLPPGCEELYKQSLSLLKAGKKKQGSFLLGGLVHYISDICIPLHTEQDTWETGDVHKEIEKEAENLVLGIKYQPKGVKFTNIFSFAVSLANDSNKDYDRLRDKDKHLEILKNRFFIACDSCYSVVSDILNQIASQKQVPSLSIATPQATTTNIPVAPDAEVKLNPTSSSKEDSLSSDNPNLLQAEQESSRQVKTLPKTLKSADTVVRVMGVLLSPDKEYRLKLIPDGAGNYYLDIWEIKERTDGNKN
jgi:hypothetical protein